MTAPLPTDRATQYAEGVVSGRIVAGRLVRLACARHLRDLEEGPARGLTWDLASVKRVLDFFSYLRLPADGELDGKPFTPEPFQAFILGSLFGWKGQSGYRRFRTGYIEQGKGNGKTPLAAGIGLYGLVGDGEAGAEVYSAATAQHQAGILFRDAKRMAEASPALRKRLKIDAHNIAHIPTDSFLRPVSSEHRGLDGKRPHIALIDEVHEHPTPLVVDKMRAGTKSRRQALIVEITNSGHDRATVCWNHHEYSAQVLAQKVDNDAWFAYVCGLDPCEAHAGEGKLQPVDGCSQCDDWRDEKTWPKANPGLDAILPRQYLREQVHEAEGMPAKEGITKRLNFCWWTEGETAWLPADLWANGNETIDRADLRGRHCFGGLDVASKIDVAACVYVFPNYPRSGCYTLLPRFWVPRESASARSQQDGIPYLVWERLGFVTLTPGEVIDQDAIEEDIKADALEFQIESLAFDPWNAAQLTTHLQEHGIKVVEFSQNIRNFNEPTKEFESLLKQRRLVHGQNPVLTWMAGNVVVLTDRSGNVRPVKPAHGSARKVDGIVAAVMALGQAILCGDGSSVYDTQPLEVF